MGQYEPDPAGTVAQRELHRHLELTRGRRDRWEDVYAGLVFEELVPSPTATSSSELCDACSRLCQTRRHSGGVIEISRQDLGDVPTWMFLDVLAKSEGILLHGSNDPAIAVFRPHRAGDTYAGGEIAKVFATQSSILAMFFAILDRRRLWQLPCVPAVKALHVPWLAAGEKREGYWFAVDHRALAAAPWQEGSVYVLPRAPFTEESSSLQWYSTEPVSPIARVNVSPEDFPLLQEVRGIDWFEDARRGLTGAPFRGDPKLYPGA